MGEKKEISIRCEWLYKGLSEAKAAYEAKVAAAADPAAEDGPTEGPATWWWRPLLEFDWKGARAAANCTYVNASVQKTLNPALMSSDRDRVWLKNLYFENALQSETIIAASEDGLAEQTKGFKAGGDYKPTVRTNDPSLVLTKYKKVTVDLKTREVQERSAETNIVFDAMEMVYNAFKAEASYMLETGNEYVKALKKYENDKTGKAAPPRIDGYVILSSNDYQDLSRGPRLTALKRDQKIDLLANCIRASSTKITSPLQYHYSDKNEKLNGKELPNPKIRCKLVLYGDEKNNSKDPKSMTQMLDVRKPILKKENGVVSVKGFQSFMVGAGTDAAPVDNFNVHKALPYGSSCSGSVDLSSICFSNFGISYPTPVRVLIVKPPVAVAVDPNESVVAAMSDDFKNMLISSADSSFFIDEAAGAAAAAAPAAAAAAAAPAAASADELVGAVTDDDLGEALEGIE
jgi:hypothetical protein